MRYTSLALTVFGLISSLAVGCAGDHWMGSVDAVFRYRPSESSTVVHEVRPGSFSDKAGLKSGDVLIAVNGESVETASFDALQAVLRGPVGTVAVLKVRRGQEIMEFTIERLPIKKSGQ